MVEFLRIFLPIYGTLFFFIVFLLRTYVVWRRTGINAYVLLKQKGTPQITGRYIKFIAFTAGLVVVIFSFLPSLYGYLEPIRWLEKPQLILTGLILLITSLLWIWISQVQMGNSWRIGIDENSKTELVTGGIFTLSRNPIFLGIKVNILGFFLVVPNALTLSILLLGTALINIQVSLEEKYLMETHGESYKRYCEKVRRWI